mgnify:CR=1 FL=1
MSDSNNVLARIVGSVDDPTGLTQRLEVAAKRYHLVAPQAAVGFIPEGCSVAISAVMIDVDNETYKIPGGSNLGLSKVALDRIAAAAGLTWDARLSGRIDVGSDPRYCGYRAVGHIRDFDGTTRTIIGEKEVDMREGSPQVDAIVERCIARLKRDRKGISDSEARRHGRQAAENQIRELRLHILGHAETKARLRAIRTLGIRTSYSPAELRKPFVVAKLAWSGRTNDPELRRAFALEQQRAMFGANAALFGAAPASAPAAQSAPALPQSAPPPVGSVTDAIWDDEDGVIDAEPHESEVPSAEPVHTPAPEASQQAPTPNDGPSGHVIPGGRSKGTPIEDAEDRDLEYWHTRIGDELKAGTARFPERDEPLWRALGEELARRQEVY